MEMKAGREKLEIIKQDKALWDEFAYRKYDTGYGYDLNGLKRYALIIELQYEREAPEELVQYLMEQEIEMHRNHPQHQVYLSLKIVSYLLAKFRNAENVWLFDKAKTANFNTYLSLDAQHLFSAGVAKTAEYIECSGTLDRKSFFQRVMKDGLRNIFTEENIEQWFTAKEEEFPAQRENESLKCLVDRAITFKNYTEGELLLQKLAESFEGPDTNYAILYQRAKALKAYNKVIYYLGKMLEQAEKPADRAAILANMTEVYLIKQDYANAYEKIRLCDAELEKFGDWKSLEPDTNLPELLLDISLGGSIKGKHDLAREAFARATELIRSGNNFAYNLLEKGRKCAETFGSKHDIEYYDALLQKDGARIELPLEK